jgi:hypothetical protein
MSVSMARGSGGNRGDNEGVRRPADLSGLSKSQERLLDRLDSLPEGQTRNLARALAVAMRRMAEDGELWQGLEEAGAAASGLGPAKYLALVDWETLLRQWKLPEVEPTALELIDAVDRGAAGQPEWGDVGKLIGRLGAEIAEDAAQASVNSGRWTRMQERMGVAGSVLRRVRKLRLVLNGAAGALGGVAPVLIAAVFGVALPAVGAVVGLGVGGAMTGIGGQVRSALDQTPGEDRSLLRDLFNSPELRLEGVGRARANLEMIEAMLAGSDGVACEEDIAGPLTSLRLWAAGLAARLLSSWGIVQARIGDSAVRKLQRILEATVRLTETLRGIAKLCDATIGHTSQAIQAAMALIEETGNGLIDLDEMLADRGFGGHGR